MIVRAASFVARRLFDFALISFLIGAGLLYLSVRLLRWIIGGLPPTPQKDATFALLIAVVTLARAVGADALLKGAPDDRSSD